MLALFEPRPCSFIGHIWHPDTLDGMLACGRAGCGALGHCPQCLGYHRLDLVVAFCTEHGRYAPYLDCYPVIPAPAAPVHDVLQSDE